MGDLSREPQVCEYRVDDLGVFDDRDDAHAATTARAGEHVDVEGAPHQVGPRPGAESAGEWRVFITAGCAVVERTLRSGRTVRPGGTTAAGSIATKLEKMWRGGVGGGFLGRRAWALVGNGRLRMTDGSSGAGGRAKAYATMADVAWRQYYWGWFLRAFRRPLAIGQAVSFLLTLVAGYAVRLRPELGGQLTYLLWAVPLAVFLATLTAGFALAPFHMHRELERERDDLKATLDDLRGRADADMHVSLNGFRERIMPGLDAAGYEVKFPAVEKRLAFLQDGWEEVIEEVSGRKYRIVIGDGERIHNLAFKLRTCKD